MLTLYIFADNLCSAWVKWLLLNAMWAIFKIYHGDDDVLFVLDQQLDFHSAHSLKQQFLGRHVAPLRHIILVPRQPVFTVLTHWKNSSWVDMSLHSDTLYWFLDNQSLQCSLTETTVPG
jgi:hypothetical protein